VWLLEAGYIIERLQGEYVSSSSDANASGDALYGNISKDIESTPFLHSKYHIPLVMEFLNEENKLGLRTYKYSATYSANVTQQYRDSAQYTGQDEIISQGKIQSGFIAKRVKYQPTVYYLFTNIRCVAHKLIILNYQA
jgi:hypothetical protein